MIDGDNASSNAASANCSLSWLSVSRMDLSAISPSNSTEKKSSSSKTKVSPTINSLNMRKFAAISANLLDKVCQLARKLCAHALHFVVRRQTACSVSNKPADSGIVAKQHALNTKLPCVLTGFRQFKFASGIGIQPQRIRFFNPLFGL